MASGDLLDDLKTGAANVAAEAKRSIVAKTVIALAALYFLTRGK